MSAAVPALAPAEVARIAAIAGLLASDHDGEALAAARLFVRAIGKHGLRPEELMASALAPRPATARERAVGGYKAQLLAVRLLKLPLWTEREAEFLRSLTRWRGRPSDAQRHWLDDLAARAGSAA